MFKAMSFDQVKDHIDFLEQENQKNDERIAKLIEENSRLKQALLDRSSMRDTISNEQNLVGSESLGHCKADKVTNPLDTSSITQLVRNLDRCSICTGKVYPEKSRCRICEIVFGNNTIPNSLRLQLVSFFNLKIKISVRKTVRLYKILIKFPFFMDDIVVGKGTNFPLDLEELYLKNEWAIEDVLLHFGHYKCLRLKFLEEEQFEKSGKLKTWRYIVNFSQNGYIRKFKFRNRDEIIAFVIDYLRFSCPSPFSEDSSVVTPSWSYELFSNYHKKCLDLNLRDENGLRAGSNIKHLINLSFSPKGIPSKLLRKSFDCAPCTIVLKNRLGTFGFYLVYEKDSHRQYDLLDIHDWV